VKTGNSMFVVMLASFIERNFGNLILGEMATPKYQ
jgi:hypothetical protein